jgi:hypothetical protein
MRVTEALVLACVLVLPCACARQSEAREAESFAVSIEAPREASVGQKARAVVRLLPRGQYHVNTRYPISVTVVPPAGVELAKARLSAADGQVSEKEARFEVAFTPREQGQKAFTGEFKFSVCTAQNCDIKKEKIAWTTAVR